MNHVNPSYTPFSLVTVIPYQVPPSPSLSLPLPGHDRPGLAGGLAPVAMEEVRQDLYSDQLPQLHPLSRQQ